MYITLKLYFFFLLHIHPIRNLATTVPFLKFQELPNRVF